MGYLCNKLGSWQSWSGANSVKGPEILVYNLQGKKKPNQKTPKKTIKNYFSTGIEPLKMNANENISVKDFKALLED